MIQWTSTWQPGCWCFDRRPIYADQRRRGSLTRSFHEYDFRHAWVWFLWAPRDETVPHVIPHAWGFANGDEWSLIEELTGRSPVLQLVAGQADWVYLCDVLVACDDMAPKIASEIALLQDEERRMNARRISEAFKAPDSEDFQMFLEATLQNEVPASPLDTFTYYFKGYELLRKAPMKDFERFDPFSRCFVPLFSELSASDLMMISSADAVAHIRNWSSYNNLET